MIAKWKGVFTHLGKNFLDILFPRVCIGCGKNKTSLCLNCILKFEPADNNTPGWIHARYSYKNTIVRKSIWHLKYKNNHDIARVYGHILYEMILGDISESALFEKREIYIIPIPISKKRERERGYNQTKLITDAILSFDVGNIFKDGSKFLKRLDTENRQSHVKNRKDRLQNIVNSFDARGPIPARAHFILIDDVVTTGATLREAKKELTKCGARKVSAYTIAH